MVKRVKKKRVTSQLDNLSDPIKTVMMAILMLIIVVPIGIIAINAVYRLNNPVKVLSKEEQIDAIWEEAFRAVESNRVGIIFDTIETTEEQYGLLRTKCNEEIENDNQKADLTVDVNVPISEPTYVDNSVDIANGSREYTKRQLVETGPIYFNDMLMVRYINSDGIMRVVSAAFSNEEKTSIEILEQSDISDSEYSPKYSQEQEEQSNTEPSNTLSEKHYVNEIVSCIEEMLTPGTSISDYIDTVTSYFTVEGKTSVESGRDFLKLNDGSQVNRVYWVAGKSDTSKTIKDRIYVQYLIKSNGQEKLVNIVVKLNQNLRIFDIDIL